MPTHGLHVPKFREVLRRHPPVLAAISLDDVGEARSATATRSGASWGRSRRSVCGRTSAAPRWSRGRPSRGGTPTGWGLPFRSSSPRAGRLGMAPLRAGGEGPRTPRPRVQPGATASRGRFCPGEAAPVPHRALQRVGNSCIAISLSCVLDVEVFRARHPPYDLCGRGRFYAVEARVEVTVSLFDDLRRPLVEEPQRGRTRRRPPRRRRVGKSLHERDLRSPRVLPAQRTHVEALSRHGPRATLQRTARGRYRSLPKVHPTRSGRRAENWTAPKFSTISGKAFGTDTYVGQSHRAGQLCAAQTQTPARGIT